MISGANYRDGVAITPDGAVYVFGIPSTTNISTTSTGKGAKAYPRGHKVTSDGALYVRYV
jgi:hypothetical protein